MSAKATFTCAKCGGTFEQVTPDAEAEAEYLATFTEEMRATGPREIVCDDCYKRMMSEITPEQAFALYKKSLQ